MPISQDKAEAAQVELGTDAEDHTFGAFAKTRFNLPPAELVEWAIRRGEGRLSDRGALVTHTGRRTGRSPRDRFIVRDEHTADIVDWGEINQPIEAGVFDHLLRRVLTHLEGRETFGCDAWACADERHRLRVRVVADQAWHALFADRLLRRRPPGANDDFHPDLTVLVASKLEGDPGIDQVPGTAFIVLHLTRRIVLIAGTEYAGEIKKSVFSFLNYWLPQRDVFSMHCSANIGSRGDTALFFGLSGTGKTTLSADTNRRLIGDDEHGWSDQGVFNIEGGCYAKCIRLRREAEPQIWNALRFGSILENVVLDPQTRQPDFDDASITENTRAAYPLEHIDGAVTEGRGGHPENIVFLTCDAFGVLPPVSRLTIEQAVYHFLSGYTAKVAGTETGITEPQVVFSTCFGAPFLPLPPIRYAELLERKLRERRTAVWLINTGWVGGGPGEGHRIALRYTRAMVRAALDGKLEGVPLVEDPVFKLRVPQRCPDVPDDVLLPWTAWKDRSRYDHQAQALARLFAKNFEKYANDVSAAVNAAGPSG